MAYTINSSYTAANHGSTRSANKIKYLVYHYTANYGTTATAKGNANYFATTTRDASAHYVVDSKSVVYQCLKDTVIGWSVGDSGKGTMKGIVTNTNSISIEMVSCSYSSSAVIGKDQFYIPEATQQMGIELGVDIMKKYNIPIENVYRHYDVTAKRCPDPFCVTTKGEAAWKSFKEKLKNAYNGVTTTTEEDDEVITDIKTNLLGADKNIKGIFKEGSNYLSCQSFKEMGLTVTSNGSKPIVSVGEVTVNINGEDKKIAGFNGNGTNYCSLRQIAEILGKEVDWVNGKVVIK